MTPIDTGTPATDALFLSGELFSCANDVVVVGTDDLNEVSAGAQLAAALGGPLLFPDARLAAEVGRLKPQRVHLIGSVEVVTPPDSATLLHDTTTALDAAKTALGASTEVGSPAVPDSSTIVETVIAISEGDRVVRPSGATATTAPLGEAVVSTEEVVRGLARQPPTDTLWMVDAEDPTTLLLASSVGKTAGATPLAVADSDILAFPELGQALEGVDAEDIRSIGGTPELDPWKLKVLSNNQQVPGGGFYVLPSDQKRRFVAFYGHPETTALGVLGEQSPDATIERMQPFLRAYEGDGSQTVPTFEMIASVASAVATEDGDYSYEWPIPTFDPWVEAATENDGYIILDLQPGRDDFLTQAKMYEDMLKLPNVGLALDPEWRLGPDEVHLVQVGSVDASEVNTVIHWLADLVRDNGLPQKMMIVHQFRTFMIQNRETLEQRPELQLIIQMDGDGTEAQKDGTYAALNVGAEDAFWSWGWKNFFDEDEPGPPTPESTMSKLPTPVYVSYQ